TGVDARPPPRRPGREVARRQRSGRIADGGVPRLMQAQPINAAAPLGSASPAGGQSPETGSHAAEAAAPTGTGARLPVIIGAGFSGTVTSIMLSRRGVPHILIG